MDNRENQFPAAFLRLKEMPIGEFYELAERRILERGLSYFRDTRVNVLQFDAEREAITARVLGTDVYNVEVTPFADMFEHECDCPAHENSGVCKHVVALVALLYYLFQRHSFGAHLPNDQYLANMESGFFKDISVPFLDLESRNLKTLTIHKGSYGSFEIRTVGILDRALKMKLNGVHWYSPNYGSIWRMNSDSVLEEILYLVKELSNHEIPVYFENQNSQRSVTLTGNLSEVKVDYGLFFDPQERCVGPKQFFSQPIAMPFETISRGVVVLEDGNICQIDAQPSPHYLNLLAGGYWIPYITGFENSYDKLTEPEDFNELSLANAPNKKDNQLKDMRLLVGDKDYQISLPKDAKPVQLHVEIEPQHEHMGKAYSLAILKADCDGIELPLESMLEQLTRDFCGDRIDQALLRAKTRVKALKEGFLSLGLIQVKKDRKKAIEEIVDNKAFRNGAIQRKGMRWLRYMAKHWLDDQTPRLICTADPETPWIFASSPAREIAQLWIGLLNPQSKDDLYVDFPGMLVATEELPRFLQSAVVICKAIGAELRFKGKSVRQMPVEIAIEAVADKQIDWFELHAEIRCDKLTIPQEEWEKIITGELIWEQDDHILLPELSQIEAIERLNEMFGAKSVKKRKELAGSGMVVSRLQIFDWIELRKLGVSVQLPKEAEQLFHRLAHFEALESRKIPKTICAKLRDYQKEGFDWLVFLYENRFGACLADDMGLGKTIQAITFLAWLKVEHSRKPSTRRNPSLIVVPPSLVFNWHHECEQFCPKLKVGEYIGAKRDLKKALKHDVVLTTYDIVRRDIALLESHRFDVVVLDETQFLKNIRASRTKSVLRLGRQFTLCLTGTPMENHVGEYYSIMNLALPGIFGDYRSFQQDFKADGDRLLRRARPFVLRRTKAKILKELPAKVENDIYLDMTAEQKEIYTRTVGEVREEVLAAYKDNTKSQAGIIALSALTRLRQVCISPELLGTPIKSPAPKLEYLLGKMQELRDEGYSALIFSQFTRTLDVLEKAANEAGVSILRLDGKTPVAKRKTIVGQFQKSATPQIFLISLKAGGVGLNLTRANYVFHADPWWNPAVENQASDRAHRIGQKSTVFIQRVLMRHSIEEKMMELKNRKQALFDVIIGDAGAGRTQGKAVTKDDFEFLLS